MRVEWTMDSFDSWQSYYTSQAVWEQLGMGYPVPEGHTLTSAINAAEKIWLKAMLQAISGPKVLVSAAFQRSLEGPITLSGQPITFGDFERVGRALGVDYQIEAFCAGVPIDHILGE